MCNVLHRHPPRAVEWKEALLVKSLDVLNRHPAPDRDLVLRWFSLNREDQSIPIRLDFVLDAFDSFLERARKEFP